ncbi:hypothetical protein [Microvirga vignae]|uniref:hypothetical protein n=1 Tax=Microvirga vignae TaxID=1225564 RepID=UPI000AB3D2D3|nr:hypothetical protein [Microvirga vignae]
MDTGHIIGLSLILDVLDLDGGAKGSGAPKGRSNGRHQHGMFTCEAIEQRREIRALIAEMRASAEAILQGSWLIPLEACRRNGQVQV